MIPVMKSYNPPTSHSKKFCAPCGTIVIFRVATCAKIINPKATTQLTTIEFVTGKSYARPISTALAVSPCPSSSGVCAVDINSLAIVRGVVMPGGSLQSAAAHNVGLKVSSKTMNARTFMKPVLEESERRPPAVRRLLPAHNLAKQNKAPDQKIEPSTAAGSPRPKIQRALLRDIPAVCTAINAREQCKQ